MKASLQLRLSQHLALTPQLQQSIRLLQLSTLELQQEVAMAVAQNPLLENEDDWIASPLRVAADGTLIAQAPSNAAPEQMIWIRAIDRLPDDEALQAISVGWPAVLANLKSLLETGHVLPRAPWEMHAELRDTQMARNDPR